MPYYTPHKKISFFFITSSLAIFLLTLIFFFTRPTEAFIEVMPNPEEIYLEEKIKLPTDLQGEFLEINLEKEILSSPKNSIEKEERARGEVEIINNSNQNQILVKTTRLLSPDGILFRLDQQVVVPAKGRIKASVYADKPGKESEIEPTRFTIPGLSPTLQKLIYAESKEKMVGGLKKIGIITEEEINEIKSNLEKSLNREAEEKAQNMLKEKLGEIIGWKIILGDKTLKIISEAKPNEEISEFKTKGELKISLVAIKESELFRLAKNLLEKNIPPDKKLLDFDKKNLKYNLITLNSKERKAEMEIKIKGRTIIKENSPLFDFEKIKGREKKEIKNYLEQYKEIDSVKINFSPFWKNKAPLESKFIKIKIYEK
ncbi:MAG: hypothetical protein ACK413_02130 [Patescibacteria group bacterium]